MTDYRKANIDTSEGLVVVELWDDVAPGHVENFAKLADQGFYNGLCFHRVISGFMIQGGCPEGKGTGGPGWNIPAEFNDRQHEEGVLSMARSQDPNSAGSQFFVCLDRCPHLDGQYSAFGKVVDGIEAVRTIGSTATDPGDRPLETVTINSISMV